MVSKSVNGVIHGVIKRPFCCSGDYQLLCSLTALGHVGHSATGVFLWIWPSSALYNDTARQCRTIEIGVRSEERLEVPKCQIKHYYVVVEGIHGVSVDASASQRTR